jgi:hypothetical protein
VPWPASIMASSITGAAACSPVATGSGQPATALAATVPTDSTRTSCRSPPTGLPIQVSTKVQNHHGDQAAVDAGWDQSGQRHVVASARSEMLPYEPASP